MKKILFTAQVILCASLLLYQLPGVAHAQFIDPRTIPVGESPVFTPVKGIAGIEGKTQAQISSVNGCTLATPQLENGVLGIQLSSNQRVFLPVENANARETGVKEYWVCTIAGAQELLYGKTTSLNTITTIFIDLGVGIFTVIDMLGTMLIGWAGKLLITILGQGTFIQNDLVKQAWPFVQGIANLGFIFALLYIALATTLRLESVSSSIQRLLPKLLIGALLVNFSLVIGGLLIDASRLVMAVEIQLIGGGDVGADTLGKKLVEQTQLYQNVTRTLTISPVHGVPVPSQSTGWNNLISAATRTFFILATAAGMAVLSFGLFGRYIALLILLIISPLAYLAIALPQTSSYAKEWWQNFIKWVLYGPILLFFLIIIVRVQTSNIAPVPETEAILDASFFQHIVKFIVVITLFFVSASVAKKVGGAGSASIMNFAMKRGNAALRTTGNVALGAADRLGGRAVRDFYGDVKSDVAKRSRSGDLFGKDNIASKAARFIAGPERDKDGKRKDGTQDSLGSWAASKLPTSISSDGKAAINAASSLGIPDIKFPASGDAKDKERYEAEIEKAGPAIEKLQKSDALSVTKLIKKDTATSLSKDQIGIIMKHGSKGQRDALATHKEVVKKMGDDIKARITTGELGDIDLKKKIDSRMRDSANK